MRGTGSTNSYGSIGNICFLNDGMNLGSFVIRIKDVKDRLESSTFGDLEDFFAKLEGFDRAFIEHGTVTVTVHHYLEDPYFLDGEWTVKVLVELRYKEGDFEFLPKEVLPHLHGYLDNCRNAMIYDLFPAKEIHQIDGAVTAISGLADSLGRSLNQTFIPNTSRVLRNLTDIMGRSSQSFYSFCYGNEISQGNGDEKAQFVGISSVLKEVLEDDKVIATGPYEKSLLIVRPNFYSEPGKWDFRSGEKQMSFYNKDTEWLKLFFAGKIIVWPGCSLNVTIAEGPVGRFNNVEPYISKVNGIVEPRNFQIPLTF